jgi:hypothetical protein
MHNTDRGKKKKKKKTLHLPLGKFSLLEEGVNYSSIEIFNKL